MKKRALQNLQLRKHVISNLHEFATKGGRQDSGSGDTHPDYTCHPETCNTQRN